MHLTFPSPMVGRGRRSRVHVVAVAGVALVMGGCGPSSPATADGPRPGVQVLATTSILGDLVSDIVGDAAEVSVLMDGGQDPHTFQLSARQVAEIASVDLVVANGLGLEAGIARALDQARADGIPVLAVGEALDPLPAGDHGDHAGEGDDDDHGDDDHGPFDPHVWLDARRMARAPAVIAAALAGVGEGPWEDGATALAAELVELDTEVAATMATVPPSCRQVATDHGDLRYFGARYGVDIPVTVVPGTSTEADPSARDLAAGLDVIAASGLRVLVVPDTASRRLADAVAADTDGAVTVVALPLTGLGGPSGTADTYPDLLRTVATGLAAALADCS